jgi:hypothetical protein
MKSYIELSHKILEKDRDKFISLEDYEALLAYRKEKNKGTLASHKKLKKKLGI